MLNKQKAVGFQSWIANIQSDRTSWEVTWEENGIFTSKTNPTVFAGPMNAFSDKLHAHGWLKECEAA